ncbi:hypothetical protein BKA62DRAFT_683011 [Auriculariales sp. MPI-PUGE-AT-0066]|nr:hypothetical protein BKA62DRAFT_683011 [Auriculariales sp. MPI-PUGE-AT-0066]
MSQARAFAVPPPSFQSNVNTVYSVHPQQSLAPQALAPTVFTPSSLLPQFESRLYSQSIQSSVTHHQASSSRFLPSQQQPSKPPYQSHRGSLSSFSVASSVSMSPYSLLADPFLASSSVRQQHIIPPGPWASATQSQAHRSSVNLASPHASTRSYRSSFGESPTIMALQGSATIMSRPPPIVSPSTSASLSQSMVVVESPAIESLQSISQRSSMSIPQPLTFASALSSNAASPAIAAPALIIPTLVPPPVVPSISSSDFPALPTVSAAHLPPSVAKSAAEKKTRKQSTAEISFARETSSAKSTPPIDDLGQKTPKPLETVLKAAVPTVSAKLSLSVPSTPVKESSLRVAASSGQLDESTISAVTGRAVAVVQVVPNAEMKKSRKDKKKEKRTTGDTKEAGQQLKDVDGDIGSGGSALRKGGQPISTPEPPHLSAASTSSEAKAAPPSQAVEMPVKEVKKKAALSVETSFTPTTATDLSAAAAPTTPSKPSRPAKELSVSTSATPSIPDPVPMVSKMPKKFKPLVAKPVKAKEETPAPELEYSESQVPTDQPVSSSGDSTAILDAHDGYTTPRANLADLIDQLIDHDVDLEAFAFFTPSLLETKLQTPLKYGPLVHALSALSVGGGSFANTLPSGSIDTAVSSFQQLLETLTQTISDLLRLLPRNTWDDSSSFDGVLRDMLKGDDFLDEHGEGRGTPGPTIQEQMLVDGRDDEVAVLTQALEKRARWMEVQLAKLEELHRDINTAAVRAVLSLNDAGWDRIAPDEGRFDHIPEVFLPRSGGTIQGYDEMTAAASRMTVAELETQLAKEQERELAAEDALLRVMNANTQLLGYD